MVKFKTGELWVTSIVVFLGMISSNFLYEAITGKERWVLALDNSWSQLVAVVVLTTVLTLCKRK